MVLFNVGSCWISILLIQSRLRANCPVHPTSKRARPTLTIIRSNEASRETHRTRSAKKCSTSLISLRPTDSAKKRKILKPNTYWHKVNKDLITISCQKTFQTNGNVYSFPLFFTTSPSENISPGGVSGRISPLTRP